MNAKDGLDGGRARRGPRVPPAVMRRGVRLIGRRCLDPALPWPTQRARAYAAPAAWADAAVSPLRAEQAGLPPLLIQAATAELLALDAERLAASATAAGVDVTYTRG